jgi:hypothetical protein
VGDRARGLLPGRRPAGTIFPTTTPAAGPTAGARTACSASPTASAGCASRWRSGTARPDPEGALFGLTNPRETTARTSRSSITTSIPRRPIRGCGRSTSTRRPSIPYSKLLEENRRAAWRAASSSSLDTGVFDGGRYFDVFAEYAKAGPDHILIRITVANRGPDRRPSTCCPRSGSATSGPGAARRGHVSRKPEIIGTGGHARRARDARILHPRYAPSIRGERGTAGAVHRERDQYRAPLGFGQCLPYVKDAFHRHVVNGEPGAVNPADTGTKAALHYVLEIPAGGEQTVELQLFTPRSGHRSPLGAPSTGDATRPGRGGRVLRSYHPEGTPPTTSATSIRQGYAGLLWSKQFYYYVVDHWLEGDPDSPRRPRPARTAATATGGTCTAATSSRCPTSGSTPGSPPGTWRST